MAATPQVTAALCVIGNEILSGRTQDRNIAFLGNGLNEIGVQLREVRIVPDIEEEIVAAVNALRARYDYVFTTGGIGPTHDDITPQSIAAAFGVPWHHHPESHRRLAEWYESRGQEFTEARKRMTITPVGAELVRNSVSIAPGFRMGNVFVFAGVPQIMQAMFEAARPTLRRGAVVHSRSLSTRLVEGILAEGLGQVQQRFPDLDLGSYPFYNTDKGTGVALVIRGPDRERIDVAAVEVHAFVSELGGEVIEDTSS